MNRPSPHAGFTRRELVVALAVFSLFLVCLLSYLGMPSSRLSSRKEANYAASRARVIHGCLVAWAQDHDGEFPTARQYSNEAFRELFKAKLLGEYGEKLFYIHGDAWHRNSASGEGPDWDIGTAPEYAEALTRGECAFAYVTGLDTASKSSLPLVMNGFTEAPGVYTDDKTRKGGVFKGDYAVWVTVGGSAKSSNLSRDYKVEEQNPPGKRINVFSQQWGTNPDNIKNPEG